jgi:hypothetical protein
MKRESKVGPSENKKNETACNSAVSLDKEQERIIIDPVE